MSSQNSLTVNSKPKATVSINAKGDTIVSFLIKDAKIILVDILDKRIVDSLLVQYKIQDSLKTKKISLNIRDIKALQLESTNKDMQIYNLQKIVENKIKEIIINEDIIASQKKEIRKQKLLKIGAMISAVVLPILVLIATIK